jgi:sigma-E factor negative regulatory protein RseC
MSEWMEEQGVVISVADGWAKVRVLRQSTCGSCSARSGCGNGVLSEVLGRRALELHVPHQEPLQAGDRVTLGIRDRSLVSGALVMYLLPLAGLIGVAALLSTLFPGVTEGWLILGGLAGFGLGLLAVRRWLHGQGNRFDPVLLAHQPSSTG